MSQPYLSYEERLAILKKELFIMPAGLNNIINSSLNATEIAIVKFIWQETAKASHAHATTKPALISRIKFAKIAGVKISCVQKTLCALKNKGWIYSERSYKRDGSQQACLYWFTMPPEVKKMFLSYQIVEKEMLLG